MIKMETIIERLEFHEGCRLLPYYDHLGKLTIGIGRCIDTNPFTQEELRAIGDWKHGITRNQALMLLRNDVERVIGLLNGWEWFHDLDNERKYALIDMCYQLGFTKLNDFKKMLSFMKQKKFESAAYECLHSVYAQQVPARAQRIAHLIKRGVWVKNLKDLTAK